MISLTEALTQLKQTLPNPQAVELDDLYDLEYDVTAALKHAELTSVESLPTDLKTLYDALRYIQHISRLASAHSYDGFDSMFYNWSGDEIEQTMQVLAEFADPIYPLLQRAYQLLHVIYDIQPDINWATRRHETGLDVVIPDDIEIELEDTQEKLDDLLELSWSKALALYQTAMS